MSSAMPGPGAPQQSARAPGQRAVGITLAQGPGRLSAFLIVGLPLLIFVVIGVKTAGGSVPYGVSGLSAQLTGGTTGGTQSTGQSPPAGGGVAHSPSPASSPAMVTSSGADSTTAPPTSPATPGPAASGSATPAVPEGPAATVRAAYRAIDRHHYRTAYDLGLGEGAPYAQFAAGYAATASVALRIVAINGDVVTVALTTLQKDGAQQTFSGTYTVSGGQITGAQIQQDS